MTLPELPELHWIGCAPTPTGRVVSLATEDSIESRERIFVAEIERLRAEVEAMRAVLAKFDERWLMDGELGFCTACGTSIEGGEAHKPECWVSEAIYAARGQG